MPRSKVTWIMNCKEWILWAVLGVEVMQVSWQSCSVLVAGSGNSWSPTPLYLLYLSLKYSGWIGKLRSWSASLPLCLVFLEVLVLQFSMCGGRGCLILSLRQWLFNFLFWWRGNGRMCQVRSSSPRKKSRDFGQKYLGNTTLEIRRCRV